VRDLAGKTIPVWVPKAVSMPLGADVEVRGYYLRRYSYESYRGQQYWTPLFVAADIDPYVFGAGAGMRTIGPIALGATVLMVVLVYFAQRRERRRSLNQEDALTARRRRRRERIATVATDPR
jgi:hypothetical protein